MKLILTILPLLRVIIFIPFLVSFLPIIHAQKATIRGNVSFESTGESVIYAQVRLLPESRYTFTNADGFFAFADIQSGDHVLEVGYIGMDTIRKSISMAPGEIRFEHLFLKETGFELARIDISAQGGVSESGVRLSRLSINRDDLQILPAISGDADLAQYLEALPGVVNTGDQGGQLFLRGGSSVQNLILIDGLPIVQPFHTLGYFSVFDSDFIRNVDVFTAAYPAEYGSRVSGIVDVQTREGNDSRIGSQISVNPFYLKASVEGPIVSRKGGGGASTFLASVKNSIISESSKWLYEHAAISDSVGLPYHFRDSYLKLTHTSGNGSRFSLFGFNFTDSFDDPGSAFIEWESTGGALNFHLIPEYSNTIIHGILGYSDYQGAISDMSGLPRNSGSRSFISALDFKSFQESAEWTYGFGLDLIRTDFEFTNPYGLNISQFQNTTELHGYFNFLHRWPKWILESGIRIQYYASLSTTSFEPRLAVKYLISESIRLKGGGGIYSQNILSASTERDVVNLFTGFLTGPESALTGPNGGNIDHPLQKAKHMVLGLEIEPETAFGIMAEVYRKEFDQIIVLNRNKISVSESDFTVETGHSEGVELSIRYRKRKSSIQASYAVARVERFDGVQEYYPHFDRTHNLNLIAHHVFGTQGQWSFNIRWNLASGFPFTQTQGFYHLIDFFQGTTTLYETHNPEEMGILYDQDRDGGRLPDYHRFDVGISRNFEWSDQSMLLISLNVTNAYDRNNIFYFDRINYRRVDQLPIIPSIDIQLRI